MQDNQPGQLIVPHDPDEPVVPASGAPVPERPTEQPEPTPTPVPQPEPIATESIPSQLLGSPVTAIPQESATTQGQSDQPPTTGWQFTNDASSARPQNAAIDLSQELNWTASEFIAHEKSAGWYGILAIAAVAAAALIFLLTKDKISTGIVILAAIAFGAFANRKPHTQQYGLNGQGVQIGPKSYAFQDFKTFSIAEDGAIASIVFMPLKRFMPPLTIYVAPDIEDKVVDFLAAYLPFEQHKADAVDGLLKRIRF